MKTDIEMILAQLEVVIKSKRNNNKYADLLLFISNLLSEYDEDYYLDKQEMKETINDIFEKLYDESEE